MARDGLRDPYSNKAMGDCGEVCASEEVISRAEQDSYALASFERANNASKNGKFKQEICPVEIKTNKGMVKIETDELKTTTLEKLSQLRPAFNPPKTITAGNASTINDGASAVVLTTMEKAKSLGLNVIAIIRSWADAETDPEHFTIAPSMAIPKALKRANIAIKDVDFFEINEAFAVVALANQKRLGIPHNKINLYGGAICVGHPLGSSGSRILVTLCSVLRQENGKIGVAGICNGGGGASAMVIERVGSGSKL
jgi:acetyl-CoA C-acetyltransferase